MKKKSLATIASLVIGSLLLIVGIFKVIPLIINRTQTAPEDVIVVEEIVEVAPDQHDGMMNAQTRVTEVTTVEQVDQLAQTTCPAVLKFYAPWCGACQYLNGFYKDVAQELGNVAFYSIDVGNKKVMDRVEALQLTAKPIEYLPTLVYRANGQVIDQVTGAKEKAAFIEFIKKTFNL